MQDWVKKTIATLVLLGIAFSWGVSFTALGKDVESNTTTNGEQDTTLKDHNTRISKNEILNVELKTDMKYLVQGMEQLTNTKKE